MRQPPAGIARLGVNAVRTGPGETGRSEGGVPEAVSEGGPTSRGRVVGLQATYGYDMTVTHRAHIRSSKWAGVSLP